MPVTTCKFNKEEKKKKNIAACIYVIHRGANMEFHTPANLEKAISRYTRWHAPVFKPPTSGIPGNIISYSTVTKFKTKTTRPFEFEKPCLPLFFSLTPSLSL